MHKEPGLRYSDRIHPIMGSRVDLIQSWIPRDARTILDLGCAFGAVSAHLATDTRRVFGIDVNHRYVAEAHSSYRSVVFLVGIAEAVPFKDSSCDCVVMTEVLEHVADETATLAEVHRVLAPGGTLILTVPHRGPLSFLDPENIMFHLPNAHRFLYRLKWGSDGGMMPKRQKHRHHSVERIEELLGTRFTVEGVYRSGFLVYSLAALMKLLVKRGAIVALMNSLLSWDYGRPYGSFSRTLALLARKNCST